MRGKKAHWLEEPVAVGLFIFIMVLLILATILLLKGYGSQVVESLKNFLRFGGN